LVNTRIYFNLVVDGPVPNDLLPTSLVSSDLSDSELDIEVGKEI